MPYHILNGDTLASQLLTASIGGPTIICRECLVEGPVSPVADESFWSARNAYIGETYAETPEGFRQKVQAEFDAINELPVDSELNLWFEDDLFCQANLWFILHLLKERNHQGDIYRVFPVIAEGANHWGGFGWSDKPELTQALQQRILFTHDDIALGQALWHAYSTQNFAQLTELAQTSTQAFAHLPEVVQAHIGRFESSEQLGRPQRVVKELIDKGLPNFKQVFLAFVAQEGVYGFTDLQVKQFYDEIKVWTMDDRPWF